MNKLVIIGNGFDLAHGLPTKYEDFLLWEINEAFKQKTKIIKSVFFTIESNHEVYRLLDADFNGFKSIVDFERFLNHFKSKDNRAYVSITYNNLFFKKLFACADKNWVDIETEYFVQLKSIYKPYEVEEKYKRDELIKLNQSFDLIRKQLKKYLTTLDYSKIERKNDIINHFVDEIKCQNKTKTNKLHILNFNYTSTVSLYTNLSFVDYDLNYIHGELNSLNNPLIFGYGDETDKHYLKMEDLNENEFTRLFKSFYYLTTNRYKNLFEFLDETEFEVHVLGHSCGISDRLLFTNIFQHENFKTVKLYYYVYGENEWENDFFQKTQELSRHFDINSKHKMRTKVVPFHESKPLTQYKPKSN